ncbi:phosphate ABC transporter substrate-binding/OmpA family protein [Aestuariibius sp. 2305UL40-4]|uniref:phosphate ABC transporter substrate-binding/OmpA family protein n=1 Tax=Aestuariibius violaceus TaxID=3234132 RepID=UPI00345E3EE5
MVLVSLDGGSRMSGKLIDYSDGMYHVQTSLAAVSAPVGSVTCEGPGCPTFELAAFKSDEPAGEEVETEAALPAPTRLPADLVMVGSDNLGEDLMPLIMEPFAEVLDARLSEANEFPDYIAQYIFTPNDGGDPFVLEVESTSSGPGLERLIAGTTDIAMSSRGAEPDEVAALAAQGRGNLLDVSQEYVVAVDSVVMIVHPDNPVDALSRRQLAGIYSGQIRNWAQVGGPNLEIVPVARPGGSARRNFETWAFRYRPDPSDNTVIVDGGKKLTRYVMETPGAIGYSISDNVLDSKPIDLILDCGVRTDASPFKSKAEEYLMGRRIRLYIDNQNPNPTVRQMTNLMISPEVDDEVDESGYYSLGIVGDPQGQARLLDAAVIGQPQRISRAVQNRIVRELSGAERLSLTFRFPTARWNFDSKALRDLDRLVEYLGRPGNRDREFIFVGFADARGDYNYNVQLSLNRANEVLSKVRAHPGGRDLGRTRMSVLGYGEAAPVGCNDNQVGLAHNRRVEVWVR